jgi:hypothetical protein
LPVRNRTPLDGRSCHSFVAIVSNAVQKEDPGPD